MKFHFFFPQIFLAGWCHFDTGPQEIFGVLCQNDIPTFIIGYHNDNRSSSRRAFFMYHIIIYVIGGMSFWHGAPGKFWGLVSKWHTPHTIRPISKKKFRQNFWRKIQIEISLFFFRQKFWRNFFFRVWPGGEGGMSFWHGASGKKWGFVSKWHTPLHNRVPQWW